MEALSFSSVANKFLADERDVIWYYERHLRWYEKGPDFIRRKRIKMRLFNRLFGSILAVLPIALGVAVGANEMVVLGIIIAIGGGSLIYAVFASDTKGAEYNYSVLKDKIENPLSRMRFYIYNVGLGLRGLLRKYNFLVQGEKLGKLDKRQERLIRETELIVEGALRHFEECVEVYRWYETAASLSKENNPLLPKLGIDIEELEDALRRLSATTELLAAIDSESSEVARENAENAVVNEISLIELQQELGNTFLPPIVSDSNQTVP